MGQVPRTILKLVLVAISVGALIYYWTDRWVQDDAYISFRFAKNLLNGHGLVFNAGEYTEGYTNFLWTVLSAIPQAMGSEDPLNFMHVLSLVLWAGTYLVVFQITRKVEAEGSALAGLAILPVLAHRSYNLWFFSGMENSLLAFCMMTLAYLLIWSPQRMWVMGSICCVLLMTRMDSLTVVVCALFLLIMRHGFKTTLRSGFFLPLIVAYLPYTLWRIYYYGDFFPNTYYAKMAFSPNYAVGWQYIKTYFTSYHLLPFLTVSAVLLCFIRSSHIRLFALYTGTAFALTLLYVFRVGGDFMEWRFLTPCIGPLYLAIGLKFLELFKYGKMGALTSVLALGLFLKQTHYSKDSLIDGQESIDSLAKYENEPFLWKEIGKTVKEAFPFNPKLATSAGGMIPFFSETYALELHGLTDYQIAHAKIGQPRDGRLGHELKLWEIEKIRERGIDLLVEWPGMEKKQMPGAYQRHKDPSVEVISYQTDDGRYLDFTLLNPQDPRWSEVRHNPRVKLYQHREVHIQYFDILDFQNEVEENAKGACSDCKSFTFEIRIRLGGSSLKPYLDITLDNNDQYELSFWKAGTVLGTIVLGPEDNGGGMRRYRRMLPKNFLTADLLGIDPVDGDGTYSVGHVMFGSN